MWKTKDIEKIEIQMENLECFEFDRKDISNIFFSEITKNISICINAVIELYEAKDILFVIPLDVAKKKQRSTMDGSETSFYDRLGLGTKRQMKDITHFYIKYNTGETETISVPWIGDDDYYNPGQEAIVRKEEEEKEYLVLTISKER